MKRYKRVMVNLRDIFPIREREGITEPWPMLSPSQCCLPYGSGDFSVFVEIVHCCYWYTPDATSDNIFCYFQQFDTYTDTVVNYHICYTLNLPQKLIGTIRKAFGTKYLFCFSKIVHLKRNALFFTEQWIYCKVIPLNFFEQLKNSDHLLMKRFISI